MSQHLISQGAALRSLVSRASSYQVDLRLAAGAAAGWLAVVVALGRAPATTLTWALTAGVVGALALTGARHGRRVGATVALTACCVALVLLPLSARQARAHDSPLAQLARERLQLTAELTVTADPRL